MKLFFARMQSHMLWLKLALVLAAIIIAVVANIAPAGAVPDVTSP